MLWPEFVKLLPEPLWLWLIVVGLATWRLTSVLHHETIAKPLRRLIGIQEFGPDRISGETLRTYPDTFIGRLFECFMCLSVWCAVLMLVVLILLPVLLLPLAISALAIFAQVAIFES